MATVLNEASSFIGTPFSAANLPGDCPTCPTEDVSLMLRFEGSRVDVIRLHESPPGIGDYPYVEQFDNGLGVCAGTFPFEVSGSQLRIDLPSNPVSLELQVGRASSLLDGSIDSLPVLRPVGADQQDILRVCDEIGVPPPQADPLQPQTWDQPAWLSNYSTCSPDGSRYAVAPPSFHGTWIAGRIDVPSGGYEIDAVRYEVVTPVEDCHGALSHRAFLFMTDGSTPPAEPIPIREFQAPSDPDVRSFRLVEWALEPPVSLSAAQDLYLAIEMTGIGTTSLCVAACSATGTPASSFFTDEVRAPFTWQAFESPSIELNFGARARSVRD